MIPHPNTTTSTAADWDVIVVKSRVFSALDASSYEPKHVGPLQMGVLTDARRRPFDFAKNLTLCESVDAAETELRAAERDAVLPPEIARGDALARVLFVDTSPHRDPAALQRLVELRRRGVGVAVGSGGRDGASPPPRGLPLAPNAACLIGEVRLFESGDDDDANQTPARVLDQLRAAAAAQLDSGAPILVDLFGWAPPTGAMETLVRALEAAGVHDPTRVLVSGGFQSLDLAEALLRETRCVLVVDPAGPGVEVVRRGAPPHPHDEAMAAAVAHMLARDASRLCLGYEVRFAYQLRALGGDGFRVPVEFVARVARHLPSSLAADARAAVLRALASGNAARALGFFTPPVVERPPVRMWRCPECGADTPESDDFFESHGVRVCSLRCMRALRARR